MLCPITFVKIISFDADTPDPCFEIQTGLTDKDWLLSQIEGCSAKDYGELIIALYTLNAVQYGPRQNFKESADTEPTMDSLDTCLKKRGNRNTIVRFYWDDQKQFSVECPNGNLFCMGWNECAQISVNRSSAFNCCWQMPFKRRCHIRWKTPPRSCSRSSVEKRCKKCRSRECPIAHMVFFSANERHQQSFNALGIPQTHPRRRVGAADGWSGFRAPETVSHLQTFPLPGIKGQGRRISCDSARLLIISNSIFAAARPMSSAG